MPPRPQDPPEQEPDSAPTVGLGGTPPAVEQAAARLADGDVLAGRFRIVAFLGQGGMGEVYEAEDLELGERVALKTIRAGFADDRRAMERFKREVHLARKVTHPHACRLFDLERHHIAGRDVTFLTMELLCGETLAARLQRGALEPGQARDLALQVTEALAAAHRAGVVHRDLKPGNVMLVPQPRGVRAVVTDFGLAGISGEEPTPGRAGALVVGTPAYMSPEQAGGGQASTASDVYSLGLMLQEMLAAGPAQTATLPPGWRELIHRCLEREPGRRFADATEVAAVMHELTRAAGAALPIGQPRWRRIAAVWVAAAALAAAIATAAGVVWMRRGEPAGARIQTTRAAPMQITSSSGLDAHPSFSPDGNWIAYSSDRGGGFQIYLKELPPGSAERPLTSEGDNFEPAWSPDGGWIAFHGKRGGIWIAPVAGGAARQVAPFGSRPAWSPDGAEIAFQSQPLVDLGANAFPAQPPSTLWIVRSAGGSPRALTRPGTPAGGHGGPSWSPDGQRIVFGAADRRLAEVWSVRRDGSDMVRLVRDQPYAFDPVYAPDGRSVYYSSYSRFLYGIWSLALREDGRPAGEPVEVASLGLPRLRHLAVSRDGRRIAYSSLTLMSNFWWLPLAPATGAAAGTPQPLTSGTGKLGRPAFSPDGAWIAYDRAQSGTPEHLWLMSAQGQQPRSITSDRAEHNLASWFPDGRRLAYLRNLGARFAVWSVGFDGTGDSPLLELEQDIDWPRLSPDGGSIAFNSKKGAGTVNTWVVSLAERRPRQLTFDDELMGFPCWSPDGTLLALEGKRGTDTHVYVLPGAGGTPRQLTSQAGESWPYSFSPDGDRVAFAGQRGGLWNVWAVSRSTGRQQQLTRHQRLNAYVRTPAWSPRGDRLVYEYAETTGNVWMIDSPR